MRTPIIAGNWKMHKTVGEAVETCIKLEEVVTDSPVEVVVCAPFTSLSALSALGMEKVQLGAQNMFYRIRVLTLGNIWPDAGRYGLQLCDFRPLERREIFGEDDELINKKVLKALELSLRPILCVGETLSQRKAGETEEVVVSQTAKALSGVAAEQLPQVVIAYEPMGHWHRREFYTRRCQPGDRLDPQQTCGAVRWRVGRAGQNSIRRQRQTGEYCRVYAAAGSMGLW